MALKLYHLNSKTERVGVCKAERGKCPFRSDSPHFVSREACIAYYENELEGEYGLFGKVNGELNLSRDAVSKRLNLLPDEAMEQLVRERWRRGGYTPRETEDMISHGEPFYVNYTTNQEISLDFEHDATQRTFTKGACTVLAGELHRATGWPIVLFSDPDTSWWQGHAAVRTPRGEYLDVTGAGSNPLEPFGSMAKGWTSEEMDGESMAKIVDNGWTEETGGTVSSRLELLERFAAAKIAYDLLDREELLSD